MNQNESTQVDQNWLSGFCKAAAEAGLSEQQAQLLLKESAHRNMLETNPAYAESFNGELEKSAGLGSFLGNLIKNRGVGMALGAGGLYGGSKLVDAGQRAMLDPTQRSYEDRLRAMHGQALGGADPFTTDMAAGRMARGGRDRAKAQWDQYNGMFGNQGGGNNSRDYYRRWYLS